MVRNRNSPGKNITHHATWKSPVSEASASIRPQDVVGGWTVYPTGNYHLEEAWLSS